MIKTASEFFFQNKKCRYFPCHNGTDEDTFNCMFCYCPLYTLGDGCGGNFRFLENGIKDCSGCLTCHTEDAHTLIESKFAELSRIERQNRRNK